MKKKQYRYVRYEEDGVSSFQCLHCFEYFTMVGTEEYLYCPNCGIKFESEAIRHRYYRFSVPEVPVKCYVLEHAVRWTEGDSDADTNTDLNWTDTDIVLGDTPLQVFDLKKKLEEEQKEIEETNSRRFGSKGSLRTFYRIRVKYRRSYSCNYIYVSDIKFHKKTGKMLSKVFPDKTDYDREKLK